MLKNESGRSMVEMLGVLAIIGVLSVGGIAGYTIAMRKYKANELLAAAAQCGILARSANAGNGITGTVACGSTGLKVDYNTVDATKMEASLSGSTVTVAVTLANEKVCDEMVNATADHNDLCSASRQVELTWGDDSASAS